MLKGAPVTNDDGAGGGHVVRAAIHESSCWHGKRQENRRTIRGFSFSTRKRRRHVSRLCAPRRRGFGSDFKREVRDRNHCADRSCRALEKCLQTFKNYCEIDPGGLKDRYGIPQLRFNAKWGDNDLKMANLMYDVAEEILRAAGADNPYRSRTRPRLPATLRTKLGRPAWEMILRLQPLTDGATRTT